MNPFAGNPRRTCICTCRNATSDKSSDAPIAPMASVCASARWLCRKRAMTPAASTGNAGIHQRM